jgi:Ca-activated chloride channel homolog
MADLNSWGWLAAGQAAWLAVAGAVLALYLFRPRHQPQPVNAAFLWQRVAERLSGQRLWRRLQQNRLLWLQLLFCLLGVLGLMRPYQLQPGRVAPQVILLLDTSASMAASGRFDQVKEQARQILEQAPAGTQFCLASLDSSLRLWQPFSPDRRLLLEQLEALKPRALAGADELAGPFVVSLLKNHPQAQAHWFSDHGLTGVPVVPHLSRLGTANCGIESFQLSREGLFVAVRNFSAEPAEVALHLQGPGGFGLTRSYRLRGQGRQVMSFPQRQALPGVYQARLSSEGDALALDNQAWGILNQQPPRRLIVHGSLSPFLEAACQAATGLTLVRGAGGGAADIHLWEQLPESPPPGRHLAAAPPKSWLDGQTEDQGPLVWTEAGQRLLPLRPRSQRWGPRARLQTGLGLELTPLLATPRGEPLLLRQGENLVFLFRLENSDLPLSPELPVLLAALLQPPAEETATALLCGSTLRFRQPLPELGGREFTPTSPGLVRVGGRQLAVNFYAPQESGLHLEQASAPAPPTAPAAATSRPMTREYAGWLVALGLLVLCLEFRWWWSAR